MRTGLFAYQALRTKCTALKGTGPPWRSRSCPPHLLVYPMADRRDGVERWSLSSKSTGITASLQMSDPRLHDTAEAHDFDGVALYTTQFPSFGARQP